MSSLVPDSYSFEEGPDYERLAQEIETIGDTHLDELEAVDRLNISTQGYYLSCEDYALKPSGATLRGIAAKAENHVQAFNDYMLASDDEDELAIEYGDRLFKLFAVNEFNRVEYLNAILGEEALKMSKGHINFSDSTEGHPEAQAIGREIIREHMLEKYGMMMEHDTSTFINEIDNRPPTKFVEIKAALQNHAIDIGKVALGTGIAIVASRFFSKKNV